MKKKEILSMLEGIFSEVLDKKPINLNENTTVNDVEGWDSLAHIQLIIAIEKKFNIRFTSTEIFQWKNVGEMVDGIQSKIR
jgi:acyl carrier protein